LTPDRKKYVEEQTRRIAQEKAEKERILALVEHDRIEREVRARRKREGRAAVFATPVQAVDQVEEEKVAFNEILISVRLLHGGLIKAKFLEGKGLGELRTWVDEVCFSSSVVVVWWAGADRPRCAESDGWGRSVYLHATS